MKVVFLSDTHNSLSKLKVPDGDLLIHAGDFGSAGRLDEVARFNDDIMKLPHKHKVVVAGNHDWPFQRQPKEARKLLHESIIYLEDAAAVVEGLHIYGSPWQPAFFNWAFNLPRLSVALKERWQAIPDNTDILVTHSPPHGIMDRVPRGELVGCEHLRRRVDRIQPRIHCFGHIHCGYGQETRGKTLFINASNLDEDYLPANEPITVEL